MKKYKQNAVVLIPALIFLILAASLSLLSLQYSGRAIELIKNDFRTARAAHKEFKTEIDNLSKQEYTDEDIIECYRLKGRLCLKTNELFYPLAGSQVINGLENRKAFPQFDFNSLFKNPASCMNTLNHNELAAVKIFTLSAGSVIWHKTCSFLKEENLNNYSIISNIYSEYPLTAEVLIASSGYIKIRNTLTALNDLIILAGGDIILDNLISTPQTRITLVAASGLISINQITGNPKLKLISKYGFFSNSTLNTETHDLLPKLLRNQILFIKQ